MACLNQPPHSGVRAEPVTVPGADARSGPPIEGTCLPHDVRPEPGCHSDRSRSRDPRRCLPLVGRFQPSAQSLAATQAPASPLIRSCAHRCVDRVITRFITRSLLSQAERRPRKALAEGPPRWPPQGVDCALRQRCQCRPSRAQRVAQALNAGGAPCCRAGRALSLSPEAHRRIVGPGRAVHLAETL